jgi:heme exporter protein B
MKSHWSMFRWLIWREVLLAWRRKTDLISALAFFAIIASLFPLGLDPDPRLLRPLGGGVLWVSALLATLLGFHRMFACDLADGSLDHLLLTPQPLILTIIGKAAAQFLLIGVPLILMSPLLGFQYGMTSAEAWQLTVSLVFGVPILILLNAAGAALTLGMHGGGLLSALIVLPLSIPSLVFGAAGNISLVGAVLALTLAFAPWATAAALRVSLG